MKFSCYCIALVALNIMMAAFPWGSAYLSLIIVLTYVCWRPTEVLHPNNMIFAFYGLYIVLSSTLNLILHLIQWEYVLPWGQFVFWDRLSKFALFQAEFTFLVLFAAFRYFSMSERDVRPRPLAAVEVRSTVVVTLYWTTLALTIWFVQATAGIQAWLTDYSATFLSMREGHGLLNVVTIMVGNVTVFLLGVQMYHAKNKWWPFAAALLLMIPLSFIGGVKSRFIFLLLIFFSPYLMRMTLSMKRVLLFGSSFFLLLYLGTLIRTEGFYASAPFFLEMLIGYFNSFQLHDAVVATRDPDLFATVFQIFVKPMQTLGLITDMDANFDISVMLTKEFFPDQWYAEHATQQWPLDTELYLNYYGFYLSWLPLTLYAMGVSWLFRAAILRRDYRLVPIFMIEFLRIFSTMRGTLIPWEVFIFIVQYSFIYFCCSIAIPSRAPASVGAVRL